MANTAGVTNSFKAEAMTALHALGTTVTRATTATDTVKAALYLVSATTSSTNAAYTATGEVTGANYTTGGVVVTNATAPTVDTTTGIWTPSASVVYSNVTLATAFDAVMFYNSSQANRSISVHTFGSQTITAGTFTLTMPANTAAAALVRIA